MKDSFNRRFFHSEKITRDVRDKVVNPSEGIAKAIQEKMKDPAYLPTRAEVFKAFDIKEVPVSDTYEDGTPMPPRLRCRKEAEASLFAKEFGGFFEFLTEEYVAALSTHLAGRIAEISNGTDIPTVILETGAGDGRLSYFLKQKLDTLATGPYYIAAVDSGEWDIKPLFPVEHMDQKPALEKYHPNIVLTSWMPPHRDWTADYRAQPSVEEYILIGPRGDTGHSWLTWGEPETDWEDDPKSKDVEPESPLNPFEADGFEATHLKEAERFQIPRHVESIRSDTVAFVRRKDT